MKKLGILVDSFVGLSKKNVEKLGLEYLNHTIVLFEKIYKEGIEIELKDSFLDIEKDLNAKTSMPSLGSILEKFEKMSIEYENIIYIPLNKGLSSTFSIASAAAVDFPKVNVVVNKLVGTALLKTGLEAIKKAELGVSIKEIINFINDTSEASHTYVIPKDVEALIRGGRLTSTKKFIMQKAKLIPRLDIILDGIKVSKVGRNFGKLVKSSIAKAIKTIDGKIDDFHWEVIHTGIEKTKNIVIHAYREAGINNIIESWTSSVVAIHTGIGAICINVFPKFNK